MEAEKRRHSNNRHTMSQQRAPPPASSSPDLLDKGARRAVGKKAVSAVCGMGGLAMPVNMDPKKRLKKQREETKVDEAKPEDAAKQDTVQIGSDLDVETPRDRELALADAEWKNLWDATEVIDMDKW